MRKNKKGVADNKLKLSNYNQESPLFTIYPCYGNLICILEQQSRKSMASIPAHKAAVGENPSFRLPHILPYEL